MLWFPVFLREKNRKTELQQTKKRNKQKKIFKWTDDSKNDIFPGWPHMGLPNVWDFGWVQMTPIKMLSQAVDMTSC